MQGQHRGPRQPHAHSLLCARLPHIHIGTQDMVARETFTVSVCARAPQLGLRPPAGSAPRSQGQGSEGPAAAPQPGPVSVFDLKDGRVVVQDG